MTTEYQLTLKIPKNKKVKLKIRRDEKSTLYREKNVRKSGKNERIWKNSDNRTWSLLCFLFSVLWAQVFQPGERIWNISYIVKHSADGLHSHYHSLSLSISAVPFHLIVYICMLEFMFTSFDFVFLLALLLKMPSSFHCCTCSIRPKWKMCTALQSLLSFLLELFPLAATA